MGQPVGYSGGTTRAQPFSIVHLRFAGVLSFVAASLVPVVTIAGQPGSGNAPAAQVATPDDDPEAEPDRSAPVLIGGEAVIWVNAGAGPFPPEYRAERISQRATDIVHDRSLPSLAVTVTDTERSSELRVGSRLLMVVTARDAENVGVARSTLAAQYARDLEAALRAEKLRYAPATLVRSGLAALAATAVLAVLLVILARATGWIRGRIRRWQADQSVAVRVQQVVLVSAADISRVSDRLVVALRLLIILLAFDLYLTFVLGLFPWTRAVSLTLLNYLITPIQTAAAAFVGYLPKLLFVIVIGGFVYLAIRLVGLFFQQIRQGRIVFASFPLEWADPTNKIIRVLLIAFGVIVAFPYLPASDSAAFAGVSVFIGILVSLSSSSAISNMIAGIVLTYTSAFRLGDRVKIGDAIGDIIETSLLATRMRTIKNEHITIPNSIALGSAMTNYCRTANTPGLILHTRVTIGYEAPWHTVHDLLIGAALGTAGLRQEPRPFVWQTALNDFYVTYEINAYTDTPHVMDVIYAELHARIQDAFFAAGVEIMSPHFTAVRDGNAVAIPEGRRAPGYRAPAFRVEPVEERVSHQP